MPPKLCADSLADGSAITGSQSKLFSRAAACNRLMNRTADPMKKQILQQLRDVWIALANEHSAMSARGVASEMILRIEEIEDSYEASEKSI